jgi:hypothetical protein
MWIIRQCTKISKAVSNPDKFCRWTTTFRGATTIYGGKINLILHFHFPLLVYLIILFLIISFYYFIINYLIIIYIGYLLILIITFYFV